MGKKKGRNETKKKTTTSAGDGSTTGTGATYRYATAAAIVVVVVIACATQQYYLLSSSTSSQQSYDYYDPNLREMKYDIGNGEQTFLAYVTPEITSFYKEAPPLSRGLAQPEFKGLAVKFINMSNKKLRHYWQSSDGKKSSLMGYYEPFSAGGFASKPGTFFCFTPENEPDKILIRFEIQPYPKNIYVYNPYLGKDQETIEQNFAVLTREEQNKYDKWKATCDFNDAYLEFTGRSYLANYLRKRPLYHMWPADYFGQQHKVTTQETHFVNANLPPKLMDSRLLANYRQKGVSDMDMTLTVLSCAPRVFEIRNFLSKAEAGHLLQTAVDMAMKQSMTSQGGQKDRTSKNTWVPRHKSLIVDSVYRRAADLMRIDEALFRNREYGEHPELDSKKSIAEHLQAVHYDESQQYMEHHDFRFPSAENELQPARFATLLLYLNDDGLEGGETSFPRWQNAETANALKVTPEIGKAILFYNQLPDGNMDDLSEHAALKVKKGEKWLMNLWVWDPHFR